MECDFVPLSSYNWNLGHASALPWNPTVYCLVATFLGISIWQSLQVLVQVYFTFKTHRGLYFWSIVLTSWGLSIRAAGWILKFFVPDCNLMLSTAIVEIGWAMMTTGLSVVLYSRLHLVVRSRRILRLVLSMIVVDAIILHIPMIVIQFGVVSSARDKFLEVSTPFERTQITLFTIQETIISGIYIWAAVNLLQRGYNVHARRVMASLIVIQVVVILIDVLLITLDFANYFVLKAALHGFGYAIKLQLEFEILNQLLGIIKQGLAPTNGLADSPSRAAGVGTGAGLAVAAAKDDSSHSSSSAERASQRWWKKPMPSFSEKIASTTSSHIRKSPKTVASPTVVAAASTPPSAATTVTVIAPLYSQIMKTEEFEVSHQDKSLATDSELGTQSRASSPQQHSHSQHHRHGSQTGGHKQTSPS